MAVLPTTHPTLIDLARRQDPDGKIALIVEILNQTNPILDQMSFMQGNLPTGHRATIRTGLPEPTWRKLYGGVQPTKSTTAQVDDSCGMLEAYSEVDKALADLSDDVNGFRFTEDRAHIEGMSQNMATTLFYGDESVNPERFTGFAPRYNSLSAANAENIIDGGGSGSDNASIWLVCWSPNTVTGIIPKGSVAGIQHKDKGQVTIEDVDGNGGRMEAYRSHYRWDAGLHLKDWRYVVRIANIDRSELTNNAATGANLVDLMIEAIERLPSRDSGQCSFYMDRSILTKLRFQMKEQVKQSTLAYEDIGGRRVTMFDTVPVYRTDALAVDEAAVT